ncbi:MAG: ribulose-phosphate 3-epimerase [Lachnospiraceae bacterium]|jgi:ribulose-phosphate 3-epimerase|nr:ribulose-phosphate 3-epimerase [Lachnospiraceae bacterium]
MKRILAPSVLAADFKNLGEAVEQVAKAGAEYIHIDVMDGMFVPSISFGMPVIKSIRSSTDKVFDVHMMVEEPGRYAEDMKKAGADLLCVHQEACRHLDRTIQQIHSLDMKAAVAINPATPVSAIELVLDQVDMVLIMSVNPGFGGQKFIPYTLEKVRQLRSRLDALGLFTDIQIDGGITLDNVGQVLKAGANIIVAGSAVFGGDPEANTRAFLEKFGGAFTR